MSILIKGISMPHGEYEGIMLAIYDGEAYNIGTKQKHDAVEVPQHGRLIDADALWEAVYKMWGLEADPSECSPLMSLIVNAPTIIEAEDRK